MEEYKQPNLNFDPDPKDPKEKARTGLTSEQIEKLTESIRKKMIKGKKNINKNSGDQTKDR